MDSITKKCTVCGKEKPATEFVYRICKECKYKNKRDWYSRSVLKVKEYNKKWQLEHPEYEKLYKRKEREKDPQKVNSYKLKLYYAKHEQYRDSAKKWRDANPEKAKAPVRNRRAQKKNRNGKITAEEWTLILQKYNYTCLCCGRKEPEIKITLDHVIPLSKGGLHKIDNAQPLCYSCNSRKGTKTIDYR